MDSLRRQIRVDFEHQVHFTEQVFAPANRLLRDVLALEPGSARQRVLVVVDEKLGQARPQLLDEIRHWFQAHADRLNLVAPPFPAPGGEATKNTLKHVEAILSQLNAHHIDRHSYLIAIGGGALLDMAGFAAAIAHRGVRHVRLPTTTLSQCDSGVGVKNGINAFGKKNFVGSFAPPFAVINDFAFLDSLESRDLRAGYSEAVKVALIRDRGFFEELEQDATSLARFEPTALRKLIRRCAELHLNHIATAGDPFELGSARPLDFGHWAAHKLEQLSSYRLRHGEAVAVGVALDTLHSQLKGFLPAADCERVLLLLEELGFKLFVEELDQAGADKHLKLLAGLEEFREHLGGELTITLLRGLGQGFEVHDMDSRAIEAAICALKSRVVSRRTR